jgi:hypothetical protein
MEDLWDSMKKNVWDKNWKNLEYETYELVEQLWQEYLTKHLDHSRFGFSGFLMGPHTSIRFNSYRVRFEIKTWLEVKHKIFQ